MQHEQQSNSLIELALFDSLGIREFIDAQTPRTVSARLNSALTSLVSKC
jgi:hypothetical protein